MVGKANITSLPPFFLWQEIVYINCEFSLSDILPPERGNPGITQGPYLKLSPFYQKAWQYYFFITDKERFQISLCWELQSLLICAV